MKKISFFLFLLFVCNPYSYAQEGVSLILGLGYSFQNNSSLNQSDFYDTDTFSVRFGGNYQRNLAKKLIVESGLIGKYSRGAKETELINFVSHNFRIQLPIYLGIKASTRFKVLVGIGIENNRDLEDINLFNKDHNLRLDFINKIDFSYSERIHVNAYSNWSVGKSPILYSIGNPDNGIFIGLSYHFND